MGIYDGSLTVPLILQLKSYHWYAVLALSQHFGSSNVPFRHCDCVLGDEKPAFFLLAHLIFCMGDYILASEREKT
jgi:hypothetical protein